MNSKPVVPISITAVMSAASPAVARVRVASLIRIASSVVVPKEVGREAASECVRRVTRT